MAFDDVHAIRIDPDGDLILVGRNGEWLQRKPRIFQERAAVGGKYELLSDRQVGFTVGHYDRTKPLVIDPIISYATYLGENTIRSVAVDAEGMVYVTGDLGFVAKLNSSGTVLIYSTFIGGTGIGWGIALDAEGNAYITGNTTSNDFPVTPGALQTAGDAFLAKLDSTGSKLLYSTRLQVGRLGASGAIAVSPVGDLYIAGSTNSPDFPVVNALQPKSGGGTCPITEVQSVPCSDAFLMHWRSSDMTLLYSTLLGGSSNDEARALAIDAENNVYLTGDTTSSDFPLANPIQSALGDNGCYANATGCGDAFVAKISADGRTLVYSTFLGGAGYDYGVGIAVDSAGNAYITGNTHSANFPTVHAFQSTLASDAIGAAFIAKIDSQGRALVFSTYYNYASPSAVVVDAAGNAYVALEGSAVAATKLNPCAGDGVSSPAFLAAFRPDGSLAYSALFGGTGSDSISGMALDTSGQLYLAGNTTSGDFPTTAGSYQTDLTGNYSDFVAKIDLAATAKPVFALAPACIVNAANYTSLADGIGPSGFVAPGEIIAVFGNGLGPASPATAVLDSQNRIATSLAGVSLTFDGLPAPLLYVQANQVNAIVPFGIAGKKYTMVALQYSGTTSQPAKMHVADSVPGVFTIGGMNQIAAFNHDGTLNSPANPAARGSVVVMWATGMGLLNQTYADGQIVRGTLGTLLHPPQILVNGLPAETRYLGQAPDLVAGAVQINLVVPINTPPGANRVSLGGTISVK